MKAEEKKDEAEFELGDDACRGETVEFGASEGEIGKVSEGRDGLGGPELRASARDWTESFGGLEVVPSTETETADAVALFAGGMAACSTSAGAEDEEEDDKDDSFAPIFRIQLGLRPEDLGFWASGWRAERGDGIAGDGDTDVMPGECAEGIDSEEREGRKRKEKE